MSSYKYAKLEQDRQTRLADILPGKLEDQVRVAFRVAAIPAMNNQGNSQTASNIPVEDHPHYEALSYAWGPLSDTVDVLVVNGHVSTIPVTRNLEEGLRHLRYEDRPRTMWIDALCINQVNLRERSWHVAKMCNIYAAAYRVVVWLGLEADDSAYALNELAKLGKQLDVAYNTEKITILSPVDGEPPPRDETTLELRFGKRELEAVAALIDRNWFGRLWIRQEIYVASSASVICGRTEVPWDAVARGLFCVWQWPKRDVLEVKVLSRLAARLDLVRLLVDRSRHMSYKYLRRELAGVHWTDPRDAVYAVQGMLRSEDRAVGVVPDYSLPPARVYTDVAVRVMQAQESLDVTSSCDMAQHYMEGLPSWVPDWWRHTNMKMEGTMEPYWYASGPIYALFSYLGDGVLRVAGIRVTTVESVSLMKPRPGAEFNPDFLQSLRSLPLQDALDPGAMYVDGTSLSEAYCRLLCCERFDEDTNLYREWVATRDECSAALREILSSDMADPLQDKASPGFKLMRMAHTNLRGRCFFRTAHGHCGSASEAAQPGDLVCVFIGSSRPSLLRAVDGGASGSEGSGGPRWRLISDSYVPGLMAGEAVHGRLPGYYKPTQCRPPGDSHKWRSGIRDTRTGDLMWHGSLVRKLLGLPPGGDEDGHRRKIRITADEFQQAGVHVEDFELV